MKKNRLFSALALACGVLAGAAASAQSLDAPWLVRARAVHLDSANKDSTGLGLSINDKWIPEVDISYFFSPNLAAELILTYPQKHRLYSNNTRIGSVKHLPPTLLAQYHFTGLGAFKPYVGAGLNYTRFSGVRFDEGVRTALGPSVKKNSIGGALQLGFDYALDSRWSLNFDVKKVYIDTDVSSFGNKAGTFKVDPLLFGVGMGYRF